MAVNPKPLTDEEIAALDAAQSGALPNFDEGEAPKKRGRKPGTKNVAGKLQVTKQQLQSMLEMLSFGLSKNPRTFYYQLTTPEIEALTDSWYEVIKMYPSMGRYLVAGNKFTVWGQALFTTYMVMDRKAATVKAIQDGTINPHGVPPTDQAGTAQPNSGTQRNGQIYATVPPDGDTKASDHFGYET